MSKIKVGLIGGTGLEDPQILSNKVEKNVTTVFGAPSSSLTIGQIDNVDVVLLSRHGKKHEIGPSEINYCANILALKNEGCSHILTSNACGSLKEEYQIGDLVVLDQFIDRTYKRETSFYSGKGREDTPFKGVHHIPMGDPFCEDTRRILIEAMKQASYSYHERGTIVVIEGPRFSTRAESRMFGLLGGHVIGMTTSPEACLARELGISYASIATVTDYDSWKEGEHVTVEKVFQVLKANSEKVTEVLVNAISMMGKKDWSDLILKNEKVADVAGL